MVTANAAAGTAARGEVRGQGAAVRGLPCSLTLTRRCVGCLQLARDRQVGSKADIGHRYLDLDLEVAPLALPDLSHALAALHPPELLHAHASPHVEAHVGWQGSGALC